MTLHANAAPARGLGRGNVWRQIGGRAPTGSTLVKGIFYIIVGIPALIVVALVLGVVLYVLMTLGIIIVGICSVFLQGMASVQREVNAPRLVIEKPEEPGRPLEESERVRVVRDNQAEPASSPFWEVSNKSRTIDVERAEGQPMQVLVMNACYATQIKCRVPYGEAGYGPKRSPIQVIENPHQQGGQWISATAIEQRSEQQFSLSSPSALHVKWDRPRADKIGFHFFELQDPPGEAVIRTQGTLPPRAVVPWGIIPTHFGGKALTGEGTIIFLDQAGQYLTTSTPSEAPNLWALPAQKSHLDLVKDEPNRIDCSAPLHHIRLTNPDVLAGHRLWVMMPTGGHCFVNWKITRIAE